MVGRRDSRNFHSCELGWIATVVGLRGHVDDTEPLEKNVRATLSTTQKRSRSTHDASCKCSRGSIDF